MGFADAVACCRAAGGIGARSGGGYSTRPGGAGVGLPGGALGSTITPAKGVGLVQTIAQALQAAIHGSNSVSDTGANGVGYSMGEAIDFPMVDPYRPFKRAGRPPISGMLAFPAPQHSVQPARNKRFIQLKMVPKKQATQNFTEHTPFGFVPFPGGDLPSGYSLGSGGKLATVLGTIERTLPATISALRASPQNLSYYPSTQSYPGAYSEYPGAQGAGANIGAQAGSAVGNIGDTVSNIVRQHPLLVLGGVGAAVLLFMSPPRRRR